METSWGGVPAMTIADWLVKAMISLKKAGVPNGRTDALIMLADQFKQDKSWVHTHPEVVLERRQLLTLNHRLKQRTQRLPLAYIRGFQEFYGRQFKVTPHVLIPRPESESFIELLKSFNKEMPWIADIGTGSGCLAITAALELPEATVHAYDIDPDALNLARRNARAHEAHLRFYQSNLLGRLRKASYDFIIANLPYVPDAMITSPEITKEPRLALFSGNDGMDHYRDFWQQVNVLKTPPRYIMTESLNDQHETMRQLASRTRYKFIKSDMLVQVFERYK